MDHRIVLLSKKYYLPTELWIIISEYASADMNALKSSMSIQLSLYIKSHYIPKFTLHREYKFYVRACSRNIIDYCLGEYQNDIASREYGPDTYQYYKTDRDYINMINVVRLSHIKMCTHYDEDLRKSIICKECDGYSRDELISISFDEFN